MVFKRRASMPARQGNWKCPSTRLSRGQGKYLPSENKTAPSVVELASSHYKLKFFPCFATVFFHAFTLDQQVTWHLHGDTCPSNLWGGFLSLWPTLLTHLMCIGKGLDSHRGPLVLTWEGCLPWPWPTLLTHFICLVHLIYLHATVQECLNPASIEKYPLVHSCVPIGALTINFTQSPPGYSRLASEPILCWQAVMLTTYYMVGMTVNDTLTITIPPVALNYAQSPPGGFHSLNALGLCW